MEKLRGKVAVVTGGASGIGKAVAGRAAAEGMKVVLADIEESALKEAELELSEQGADVISVVTDVADANSVRELRDQALRRYGAVHLIHNNAGVGVQGLLWTVSEEDWRWILGVNLWGVIHGIATFVPLLIDQGEGHVVNTASVAGLTSSPMSGPYGATKHAIVTISETLYRDLEMVGAPVGVSVLCPGFVQTRMAESSRNRPAWAPERDAGGAARTSAYMRKLAADGIAPAAVAKCVMDAVQHNTFYILTEPRFSEAIKTRMEDILLGRSPSPIPGVATTH
jgi:NAD(P)-dependent dehydrogenase (short-subunit alcohol dehydrogenase family)